VLVQFFKKSTEAWEMKEEIVSFSPQISVIQQKIRKYQQMIRNRR
jgi:hypothetical protein